MSEKLQTGQATVPIGAALEHMDDEVRESLHREEWDSAQDLTH